MADEDPDGSQLLKLPARPGTKVAFRLKGVSPTFVSVRQRANS